MKKILLSILGLLLLSSVTIAKAEQVQIVHWWVLRRVIKNFFISIALFFVVRLNKALTAINNRITKKI